MKALRIANLLNTLLSMHLFIVSVSTIYVEKVISYNSFRIFVLAMISAAYGILISWIMVRRGF